jgi:hypothetical protein
MEQAEWGARHPERGLERGANNMRLDRSVLAFLRDHYFIEVGSPWCIRIIAVVYPSGTYVEFLIGNLERLSLLVIVNECLVLRSFSCDKYSGFELERYLTLIIYV